MEFKIDDGGQESGEVWGEIQLYFLSPSRPSCHLQLTHFPCNNNGFYNTHKKEVKGFEALLLSGPNRQDDICVLSLVILKMYLLLLYICMCGCPVDVNILYSIYMDMTYQLHVPLDLK